MKITDIRATTVTVPLEAPLLHAATVLGRSAAEKYKQVRPTP